MGGPRVAGILLHPTSLPGPHGIGEIGRAAFAFLDFLHETGQGLWQVLPLGPTGYGDSPYQCFSSFAGNPLLVSLDGVRDEGWLSESDLRGGPGPDERAVDFGRVIAWKAPLFEKAWAAFQRQAPASRRDAFEAFTCEHAGWLADFALFMALKRANAGAAWNTWERGLAQRQPEALECARRELARELRAVEFTQWLFFEQWSALREAARARGVRLMGDVPIFVAHDSADVWGNPGLFQLAPDGRPSVQAGVPPDYFSATGQLWGNPLYRWDAMARTGYAWWTSRLRSVFELVDLVRLDHFRGFEAYWEVPGDAQTAIDGRWVKGPGVGFFEAVRAAIPKLSIVAEDLGVITPEVEALRDSLGLPGMAVLQFAFASDAHRNGFLPHNYERNTVAYTGTHDNDTVVGWWSGGVGDSTRTQAEVDRERERALAYVGGDGSEIHWDFIRTLLVSVADVAIVPLQDVLGVGSEGRMNLPGRSSGNWQWRFASSDLTPEVRRRLRAITEGSGRTPPPSEPKPPQPVE